MPLFHYTDAHAVYSILCNKTLRATDIRFLNDSHELHDGVDIFSKELAAPMPGLFDSFEHRDMSTKYLNQSFSDEVSFGIDEDPIFVCSFSRADNLLSQWRAYGSYAIEFHENILKEHVNKLQQCTYDLTEKYGISKKEVTRSISDISQDMKANDGRIGESSLDALGRIIERASTFKHDGFSEEQEVRIISRSSEHNNPIRHYVRGNALVPYIEIEIPLDCIKSVHVGPIKEQELACKSMESFIRTIERDWQIESNNIEYELGVKKSNIPFRG